VPSEDSDGGESRCLEKEKVTSLHSVVGWLYGLIIDNVVDVVCNVFNLIHFR
jgi:hypothetical protein